MAKWYGVYQSIMRVRLEARWSHGDHSGLLAEVALGGGAKKVRYWDKRERTGRERPGGLLRRCPRKVPKGHHQGDDK